MSIFESTPTRVRHRTATALLTASFLLVPTAAAQATSSVTQEASTTALITNSEDSAQVRVLGMGATAEASAAVEARRFTHSDLQPTGRFVQAGDSITFDVSGSEATVSYAIVASGVYSGLNNGTSGEAIASTTALNAGSTTVTADSDGLVYLVNSSSADMSVTVSGGTPVPVFVAGETSAEEFSAQLEQWSSAPFVTFVGNRVFADMQRSEVDQVRANNASWDPEAMVDYWDQVVSYANDVDGLVDDASGVADKSSLRIRVANPDTAADDASAEDGLLSFPVDSGAGQELLSAREGTDSSQLWQEVGYTYQNPEYIWDGMDEAQVGVYTASIESLMGMPSSYSASSEARQEAESLFSQPVEERSSTGSSHELMYEQLRHAFGDAFYPRLNQEYRVQLASGQAEPTSDDAEIQLFIVNASTVANRDLTEFFAQWGLDADADTQAAVADLPDLTNTIWDTLDPEQMAVENTLAAYQVPTGDFSTPSTVSLGQTTLVDTAVDLPDGTSDQETTIVAIGVNATASATTGTSWVMLQNNSDVREVLYSPVTVERGEGLTFRSSDGDEDALTLALASDTGTLQTWSSGRVVNSDYSDQVYFSLELRAADGSTVAKAEQDGASTADTFAATLSGVPYQDGQYLIATHQEPDHLDLYTDSTLQGASTDQTQAFRIENGSLVRVPLDELP